MKFLKKLSAFVLAIVMCASVLCFAACGDEEGKETVRYVYTQTPETMELDFEYEGSYKSDSITSSSATVDGVTTDNKPSESSYEQDVIMSIDAVADIKYGDADILFKQQVSYGEDEDERTYYSYFFARGWDISMTGSEEELTDFTARFISSWQQRDLEMWINRRVVEKIPQLTSAILSLGENFDAVTVSGDTRTVDLSKLFYNLKTKLGSVIDSLKPTTTVGELLNDETVKTLISSVVNVFTPQEFIDLMKHFGMYEDNFVLGYFMPLFEKVKPDENSTTFDYLLKLISSDEAYTVISDLLKEGTGVTLPSKLNNITVGFIFDLIADGEEEMTFDWFIAAIKDSFGAFDKCTATEFVFEYTDEYTREWEYSNSTETTEYSEKMTVKVTDAKMVYTLSEGGIVSVAFDGKYSYAIESDSSTVRKYDENNYNTSTYKTNGEQSGSVSGSFKFGSEKPDLKQILVYDW